MKTYLPFKGEFGGELLKVVPHINGDPEPKVVYCGKGKKCLYPSASKIIEVEPYTRIPEEGIKPTSAKYPATWFIPKGKNYTVKSDVVVFPRRKQRNYLMNWPHWDNLVKRLAAEGLKVFAAGSKEDSASVDCECAWDYDNELEVSLAAIKQAKMRVGLITALHVLSLMCGCKPHLLVTPDGRKHVRANVGPNLGYFKFCDHLKVGWEMMPYLDDIDKIVKETCDAVNRGIS